jgi:ABC-type enterochelin transport system permease subunit
VAIAGAGFLLGGFALVDGPNWVLFWIAAALCVVALIVARVMQVMGYGAD